MISERAKIEIAAAFIALLLIVYGFHTWLAEHDARIGAQEQISAAQKSFDLASAELKQREQQDAQRDASTQAAIAKLAAAAAEQKTPQQITQWVPAQIPNLPAPIKATAPEKGTNAPAVFEVPQVDLSYLKQDIATCQQNAAALAAAQADVASCAAQKKILQAELVDVEKQRDALQTELKGGTFWRRVKHDLKAFAIGAGIGAAALCASGHCK